MTNPVIEARDLTKVYDMEWRQSGGIKTFLHTLPQRLLVRRSGRTLTALDRVSFEVHSGETFGIIGRNGAGKSTLLSLIAGVIPPTSGTIRVNGRISPLLGVGVGFAPDLSGRQNIILNGVLLGMTRHEIESLQEEIIEFSGVREFIDQPLNRYSSGMQARLGFSVAIHGDPKVLLCDEVFAVGDAEFQSKCFDKVEELQRAGVTTVLVSHNLERVQAWCQRAVMIDGGKAIAIGDAAEVGRKYRELTNMEPSP